jgi:RNA polymerase sigma-70 factor, ECF subfamily
LPEVAGQETWMRIALTLPSPGTLNLAAGPSLTLTGSAPELTDEHLVCAAQSGDPEAFAQLVTRYRRLVYAYAYARLGDREEAEDAAQESFVRAYQSLDRLRLGGSWESWMMRIVRNLCHDTLRKKRLRRTEPFEVALEIRADPDRDERQAELLDELARLPDKYRVPLTMHYLSGCTYRQVAVALELPESTVVGRMAGGLKLLRGRCREGEAQP